MTLSAKLWSLRHLEGRAANSDSKNCTAVVTTTGISQFSVALASRTCLGSGFSDRSYSTPEWCSSTLSFPRISRKTLAFWSIMDVYGST